MYNESSYFYILCLFLWYLDSLVFKFQALSYLQWMASHTVYQVQRLRDGEVPSEKLCIEKVTRLPINFGFNCNHVNYFSPKEWYWLMHIPHSSINFSFFRLFWYLNPYLEFSCSGEKATAESIADAIAENRAELVHLPSTLDLHTPLPSKDCPTCDGTVRIVSPYSKHQKQTHSK